MFTNLCMELIPEAKLCHVSDETLIQGVLAAGGLTPKIYRRVCENVVAAENNGADAIQLTCSSISPCVDVAKHLVSVPVLKVDEPMIEMAVSKHRKIGLIATAPTTLKPSTELLERKARDKEGSFEIEPVLCKGAFDAFLSGNLDKHDEIVRSHLFNLMDKTEVVLLAQASMMRIVDMLDEKEKIVPVLSSPRFAVERLTEVVG